MAEDLVERLRDTRRRAPFEPWAREQMSEAADRIQKLEEALRLVRLFINAACNEPA